MGARPGGWRLTEQVTQRLFCCHGSLAICRPGRHGQRGRAAPGLGAENHQGRLGLLCQVRGPQGGHQAWDTPGVGRTWNLTASRAWDTALLSNATCAGRGADPRSNLERAGEVAVMLKTFQGPEEGPVSSLGPGSSLGHLAAVRHALCCSEGSAAQCNDGTPALSLPPQRTERKKKQIPSHLLEVLGWGPKSVYFYQMS